MCAQGFVPAGRMRVNCTSDGITLDRSEQLLVVPTESLTGQQTTAARRALEWISTSIARLVFRYEISDFCLWYKDS